jgi:hypothetical protein
MHPLLTGHVYEPWAIEKVAVQVVKIHSRGVEDDIEFQRGKADSDPNDPLVLLHR